MDRAPLVAFAVGSVAVVAALVVREQVAGGWPWLAYNLFLAWIPVGLGLVASRGRAWLWLVGPLWLVFLPNAPYLLTDLVHLKPRPPSPIWFDAAVLGGAGALGLAMGVHSLRGVAEAAGREWGRAAAWATWLAVPPLCGLAVWLGRFLRWNSWDLAVRPLDVLASVALPILDPAAHRLAWAVTLTFTVVFGVAALAAPPRADHHSPWSGPGSTGPERAAGPGRRG